MGPVCLVCDRVIYRGVEPTAGSTMSLAITHFAVGAACTAVVLTVVPRMSF